MATASSLLSQGQRQRGRWAEARGLTAGRLVKKPGGRAGGGLGTEAQEG